MDGQNDQTNANAYKWTTEKPNWEQLEQWQRLYLIQLIYQKNEMIKLISSRTAISWASNQWKTIQLMEPKMDTIDNRDK